MTQLWFVRLIFECNRCNGYVADPWMFLYTALIKHHIYLGCAAVQTPLTVLNIETRPFKTVKEATKRWHTFTVARILLLSWENNRTSQQWNRLILVFSNPNRVRGFAVDETSPSRMTRPRATRMQDVLKLYEDMKRTKDETVSKYMN